MSTANLSYCQIMVGRAMTGLVGLDEIMASLADEGVAASDPTLADRLVQMVREHNYVPNGAIGQYGQALLTEYQRYIERISSGKQGRAWRDPRKEQKPWYPTIFADKCNGCGQCLAACPSSVLGWNEDRTKVLVLEPHECVPACQQCVRACTARAIILPPLSILHQSVDSPRQ